jgi:ABC-type phosphate transport system substrate-binding protein
MQLGAQPIYPVVRQDSSGTSEAFTNALALMDPLCAYVGAPLTGAVQPSCQVW